MNTNHKFGALMVAVSALAVLATTTHAAAPDAEMLAVACAGCHGMDGASAGDTMPSIARQSQVAFVDAMLKFKSGERESTIMGRLAKGYSDDQIKAMGAFFARQKLHAPEQPVDKAKVAKVAKMQGKACGRCHLENGKDGKDETPVMAGQWLPYLQMQMALYASGKRKMPDKMAMQFKELTPQDLDALNHFYAAQK